jgi:hypothetical protein
MLQFCLFVAALCNQSDVQNNALIGKAFAEESNCMHGSICARI